MTNLLIAAVALAAQSNGWDIKTPYAEKDVLRYAVTIEIDAAGNAMRVDMNANYKITKKSDKGFEGSFGWTDLMVEGQQQADENFDLTLKPTGALATVTSDYGDGMRRMLLPFFFTYPGKAVAKDAAWTHADEQEIDGHKAKIDYKVVGEEKVKDKDTMKVSVTLTEIGPAPMKGTGHYWIGKDGRMVKFEMDVTEWTVPVAGQTFNAKLKAEIAG